MKKHIFLLFPLIIILLFSSCITGNSINETKIKQYEYSQTVYQRRIHLLEFSVKYNELRRIVSNICMSATFGDESYRINHYYDQAELCFEKAFAALDAFKAILDDDDEINESDKTVMLMQYDELQCVFTDYRGGVFEPVAEEARNGHYDSAVDYIASGAIYTASISDLIDVLTVSTELL